MNRRRAGIVLLAVAAIVAGALWWFRADDEPETAVIERGSIDVTIETVGTVQITGNSPVRAQVSGTVVAIGAFEGDWVTAGDILILLDDGELADGVRDAEDALEAAEFALQFAELRLEDEPDSTSLLQDALVAQQRAEIAERSLDEALERRRSGAILADQDGLVLDILVSDGDRVADNQPVATLLSDDDLVLIADVDELDLANVVPGAHASFRLDSAPATEIEGLVTSTSPQAIQRGGATLFPTEISFVVPDSVDVRPGMNADVTIQTDLREDVLLVPERAIRTVGRRAFVSVLTDDGEQEIEVVLGYRGAGVAEVVRGLAEGQEVVLR